MENKAELLKKNLDNNHNIQKHLFEKGFLITSGELPNLDVYPFYGNWTVTTIFDYKFAINKNVPFYYICNDEQAYFLIGHAYNPYTKEIDEEEIIKHLSQETINSLTGVFVIGKITRKNFEIQVDASGMQYACYGKLNGCIYISSHMRLIADICDLKTSNYVSRLISYKWYRYMLGNYLPGDLTCCDELKRVIPNTSVIYNGINFKVKRFYPNNDINTCKTEEEYDDVIKESSIVLHNTMECISRKWKRPSISLTGGIDSNTTFAAANGLYDKFTTFSYVSMLREDVDAKAAKKISETFNVPHRVINVPETNEEIENFELYKAIFEHNDGDIGSSKNNDVRKKIALINSNVCDIEVKSWVSETIRAYAYKYFGRKSFPKCLKPRDFTSLYKIFLGNRKLCKETDSYFKKYLEDTDFKSHIHNYDETDFFVWEMEHGGKCGLNIGVMKSCFDITIPYNNRKLLDLLLRVPLEKRINDQHHLDIKKRLNKDLFDMNIRVINLNETNLRKKAINLYYIVNSHLSF